MSEKWTKGFFKTKKSFSERFKTLFSGEISDEIYEDLFESLILADVSVKTAQALTDAAKDKLSRSSKKDENAVITAVKESAVSLLESVLPFAGVQYPAMILIAGVNGVGKTTTIAKLSKWFLDGGKSVMLSASDTFRAAASDQLDVWAERLSVPIVRSSSGQDSAGVIYDALTSAQTRKTDVLLADTAGRLQNKKNLMAEFEKIYRVADKKRENYSLYTVLVLDAMSGQNSLAQLETFSQAAKVDGVILTKTDGTAKGGVLLSIAKEGGVPVWFVGTGEGMDDLAEFDARDYVEAIF